MSYLRQAAAVSFLLLAADQAAAAEWSIQVPIGLSADYSSNRSLQPNADAGFGMALIVEPQLQWAVETSQLKLQPRLIAQRFSAGTSPDSQDKGVQAGFHRQFVRGNFNFGAQLRSDSTASLQRSDTALLEPGNRRDTELLQANGTIAFAQRWRMRVDLTASAVDYDDSQGGRLPGYDYHAQFVQLDFALCERCSLGIQAGRSGLRPNASQSSTSEESFQAGVGWRPSASTEISLFAGASRTDSGNSSSSDQIGRLQLTHSRPRSSWSISYIRAAAPIGRGSLITREQLLVNAAITLSPRLSTSVTLAHARNNGTEQDLTGERRRLSDLSAALQWNVSPQLMVELRAAHTSSVYGQADIDTDSAQIAARIQWSPARIAWSR